MLINASLPSRERGLKFPYGTHRQAPAQVAPFAGAWIEIIYVCYYIITERSLPSRERGLKLVLCTVKVGTITVAPFAGAWIEIYPQKITAEPVKVAPFAGAWIEINKHTDEFLDRTSLPSRERGLKSQCQSYPYWGELSLPSRERGLK